MYSRSVRENPIAPRMKLIGGGSFSELVQKVPAQSAFEPRVRRPMRAPPHRPQQLCCAIPTGFRRYTCATVDSHSTCSHWLNAKTKVSRSRYGGLLAYGTNRRYNIYRYGAYRPTRPTALGPYLKSYGFGLRGRGLRLLRLRLIRYSVPCWPYSMRMPDHLERMKMMMKVVMEK